MVVSDIDSYSFIMAESRNSQYFFILGEPILKWKVYVFIASVLIFFGAGAGFIYYTMLKNRSAPVPYTTRSVSDSAEQKAAATPAQAASVRSELTARTFSGGRPQYKESRTPLERLLEQHLAATGLDKVNSYIVEGFVGAEADYAIVLMGRAPNLYKFKTKYQASGGIVEFGHQPQGAWLRENRSELNREAALYFATLSVIEGSFNHLAWSYLSVEAAEFGLDSVLELQASETWQGKECAVVYSHGILPVGMYHYIDKQTYREVYRRAEISNAAGEMIKVGLHYDPPTEATELVAFPAGYELHVDGKLMDDVTLTKFITDRVILSSLFDAPSDSSFTDLKVRP